MSGPLSGFKVLELAGIGPGPFCGMMLGDMGADVIRVERMGVPLERDPRKDPLLRNRRSVSLNLKDQEGVEIALRLISTADVLIEGYRPGVTERLGLGPETCLARNPRLVYGRMTGWGQDGPLASVVGHDINFIALTGALHLIGSRNGKPIPPANLLGDFGGGGMLLLSGVLAALLESQKSGKGQVVDASMVDGTVALLAMMFGNRADGYFHDATGENITTGAAPFYDTYETLDGKYISIGALEPQFYASLLEKLGLDRAELKGLGMATVHDPRARERWPLLRQTLTRLFKTRTREAWQKILEGTDACFAPVLTLEEAAHHPHNVARGTHIDVGGVIQNAPAPRFSRTSNSKPLPGHPAGADTESVLLEAGISKTELEGLQARGIIDCAPSQLT